MINILTWIAAACATWLPPSDVICHFERRLHPYPTTNQHSGNLVYHLFRPQTIEPNTTYPLIVWLHGYGKEEFEQEYGHLRHLDNVFPSKNAAAEAAFFMMAVQCPVDQRGFFAASSNLAIAENDQSPDTPGEAVVDIVKKLLQEEPISSERVTLVGVSGGGTACWEMAVRYPNLFAAIAPLAGHGGDFYRLSRLRDLPVWAFHTSDDVVTPSCDVKATVARLKQIGGTVKLTLIDGNVHDCWYFAFNDYKLMQWLQKQRRGSPASAYPGHVPWTWGQKAIAIGVPFVLILAIVDEVRRRCAAHSR